MGYVSNVNDIREAYMSRIEHEPVPCKVCGLVGKHSFELPPAKLRRMLFSPQVEAWCDFTTGKPVGRMLVLRHFRQATLPPVYTYQSARTHGTGIIGIRPEPV